MKPSPGFGAYVLWQLERLITRRLSLTRWAEAFERRPTDVKTVIDLAG
jgi:hypothetical protein